MKNLILLFALITALTSCNMAKRYGNIRIKHSYREAPVVKPTVVKQTDTTQESVSPEMVSQRSIDSTAVVSEKPTPAALYKPTTESVKTVSVEKKKKSSRPLRLPLPVVKKKKLPAINQVFKPKGVMASASAKLDFADILGGLLYVIGIGALVLLIIYTWEFLAAFWIALGVISLIVLGIGIGMAIMMNFLIDAIFGIFRIS